MESLYLLIPIAGVFLIVAVSAFFWAVRSGQFEDLNTEGKRILFDEVDHVSISDQTMTGDPNTVNKKSKGTSEDSLEGSLTQKLEGK